MVDHGVEFPNEGHEFTAGHSAAGCVMLGTVGHPREHVVDGGLVPAEGRCVAPPPGGTAR